MNDFSSKLCEVIVAASMVVIAFASVSAAIALTIAAFYPILTGALMASLHTGG